MSGWYSGKPTDPADARIDEQARDGGRRPRRPAERLVRASAIISVETNTRSEFPSLTRRVDETAEQFADRVRDALVVLQRGL